MDIEGSEYRALKGARRLISEYGPTCFVATHSEKVHRDVVNFLQRMGYRVDGVNGEPSDETDELVATRV